MTKKMYTISIFCAVFVFFCTSCTQTEKNDKIVIGVAWPFAASDDLFEAGVELAVKQVNNSGGISGRTLEVLKADDGADVEKGLAIAESFAGNREVQAVIGHKNSYISIPASTIYNQAGLVMLSSASTAPELTQNGYQNIFRIIPSDDKIAQKLAIHLAGRGYRRMVIYYSDDSYGTGLANSFEDHARVQGIEIVDRFSHYTSLTELKQLYKRWQAFGFDAVFIAGSLSHGSSFISDACKAGIFVPFVAGNALDSPLLMEKGGEEAEGTIIGSVFNPYLDLPEVKKFVDDFSKKYGKMPDAYAALGYDAVKMLAAAIEDSDLNNRTTVAKGLLDLGKWTGAAGIHEFDDNGDELGDLVVLKKIQSGDFEYLEPYWIQTENHE